MQTKNILIDWGYPVVDNTYALRRNCDAILYNINHDVQFVGIGVSGAMILGALAATVCRHNHKFILIGEHRTKPHQRVSIGDLPIVVVDDHFCSGKTISRLSALLQSMNVLHRVEAVIMNEWKQSKTHDQIATTLQAMEVCFPFAKIWIH